MNGGGLALVTALAEALAESSLEALLLNNLRNLGDAGALALAAALPTSKVRTLGIGGTEHGIAGGSEGLAALEAATTRIPGFIFGIDPVT